jgi:hypothetical protein
MTELTSINSRRFLLTEGGPLFRLEQRVGLIQANSTLILRRALLSILLTWVPLLILSALQGNATGQLVPVPFLYDFAAHARFLVAVPLLLLAETILGPRLAHATSHFIESGLLTEKDFSGFDRAIGRGLKWRDSTAVEVVLIFIAYAFTAVGLVSTAVHVSTWYVVRSSTGAALSWSGWWFVLFCVPLFQFLTLRWLWRLFLWAQFLWRMNNMDLQLVPTHPDEAGGLAFVGEAQRFFGVILLAYSVTVAGVLADWVIYDRYPLPHFVAAIAIYVFASVTIVLIPLLVFSGTLLKVKRLGIYQYGTLGTEYTSSFHKKWIIGPRTPEEILLGTGDIQSLADLGNGFAFVEKMKAVPMGPRTPLHLALACLIPMSPLLLTMMPLEALLKMLFKVIL